MKLIILFAKFEKVQNDTSSELIYCNFVEYKFITCYSFLFLIHAI